MELKDWSYAYVNDLTKYANDEEIAINLRATFPHLYTRQNAVEFINSCLEIPDSQQLNYAIFYLDRVIGSISLIISEDIFIKNAELGYWIAKEYWGRGIATNAVKEICTIAFKKYTLDRVYANVYSSNKGSCRVLKKCGFKYKKDYITLQ